MAENKTAPVALTTEQKLEIRNFQTKLSKIEIAKLQMQTQFEKAIADEKELVESLKKYLGDNFSQNEGWGLNDDLEWVEAPAEAQSQAQAQAAPAQVQ